MGPTARTHNELPRVRLFQQAADAVQCVQRVDHAGFEVVWASGAADVATPSGVATARSGDGHRPALMAVAATTRP